MSTASDSTPTSASSPTPSPSQTSSNSGGGGFGGNNPGSFYKNLFYILIGLLCAFGLVSFLSLMRARKRRHAIVREAERLGVIVPGIPGYVPLRDRRNLNWLKADGSNHPDWWEVEKVPGEEEANLQEAEEKSGESSTAYTSIPIQYSNSNDQDDFHPLAIIPPKPKIPSIEPIPISSIPFFPNHLAYRPESLIPPPSKFVNSTNDPSVLNELINEHLEVITIIKMPIPPEQRPKSKPQPPGLNDEDDTEGVVREWGGIELGITHLGVGHGTRNWND
ncbi:uncharacterized protein I303_102667 [Kwoniella dejecticola CBS 10117]|uniref:Uncharacterized protein n=1 Tax=Kwoniella dejecticola CBS 10117 TaxID=1296121 RepID=A0A1A6A9E3_9TREE|nr:uncharacterized protein I303_02682 [Kwoniella dejecticola CBS 10117]OBR86671.1 hypothetical protein I303_02682 [Kwoniella dejecticola CBS 10117]